MAASSNTRSGGNNKDIQKAKDKAEIKRIINPNSNLKKAQTVARGLVLLGGAARASSIATRAAANRAGASASERALAKSAATTSRKINVPKGTKVITSDKTGIAKATSNVAKVVVQKSPARVAAGIRTNAVRVGEAATKAELAAIRNRQVVAGATIAVGAINPAGKKKKK